MDNDFAALMELFGQNGFERLLSDRALDDFDVFIDRSGVQVESRQPRDRATRSRRRRGDGIAD